MTTTKIKGLCKGSFKYISHLFVVKEREMEIGLPTEVKHVAHIGWNAPDGSTAPSWMNEFKAGSDLALTSVGGIGGSRDPAWSSQDFEHTLGRPEKQKRKKTKSSSSTPKTTSARSSRSSKHKSMLCDSEEGNTRHSLRL